MVRGVQTNAWFSVIPRARWMVKEQSNSWSHTPLASCLQGVSISLGKAITFFLELYTHDWLPRTCFIVVWTIQWCARTPRLLWCLAHINNSLRSCSTQIAGLLFWLGVSNSHKVLNNRNRMIPWQNWLLVQRCYQGPVRRRLTVYPGDAVVSLPKARSGWPRDRLFETNFL